MTRTYCPVLVCFQTSNSLSCLKMRTSTGLSTFTPFLAISPINFDGISCDGVPRSSSSIDMQPVSEKAIVASIAARRARLARDNNAAKDLGRGSMLMISVLPIDCWVIYVSPYYCASCASLKMSQPPLSTMPATASPMMRSGSGDAKNITAMPDATMPVLASMSFVVKIQDAFRCTP